LGNSAVVGGGASQYRRPLLPRNRFRNHLHPSSAQQQLSQTALPDSRAHAARLWLLQEAGRRSTAAPCTRDTVPDNHLHQSSGRHHLSPTAFPDSRAHAARLWLLRVSVDARAECAARILVLTMSPPPWSWSYSSRHIEPGSKRARPWPLAMCLLCMLYADWDRSRWPCGARSEAKRWASDPALISCRVSPLSWSSSGPLGINTVEGLSRTRRNYESYDSKDGGSENALRPELKRKLGRWPIFPVPLE
jgi:hypothetical protein